MQHDTTSGTAARDAELRAVTVGEPQILAGRIELVEPDPAWPAVYREEADRVRAVLGGRVLHLEHIGSTSVPGLAAKPIIDMLLVVADPADEQAYVADLQAAGYVLRIREPDWHEHRMLKGPAADMNLHVFGPGSSAIDEHVLFRDHLRANDADRELYESTKRELATREWRHVQDYADAKTAVVQAVMARARG